MYISSVGNIIDNSNWPEWLKNAVTIDPEVEIVKNNVIWKSGTWVDGIWNDGIWEDGIFLSGTWISGTWKNGIFYNGVFKNGSFTGHWVDGVFSGDMVSSVWYKGTSIDGTFSDCTIHGGFIRNKPDEEGDFSNNILRNPVLNSKTVLKYSEYPEWLKKASTANAVVTLDENNEIVWHSGTWLYGTWKNGTWKSGEWKDGRWLNGIWENGVWKYGHWKNGTWMNGIWNDGVFYDGVWYNGEWQGGSILDAFFPKQEEKITTTPLNFKNINFYDDTLKIGMPCKTNTKDSEHAIYTYSKLNKQNTLIKFFKDIKDYINLNDINLNKILEIPQQYKIIYTGSHSNNNNGYIFSKSF